MQLPDTTQRVPRHTAAHINERIERELECRITYYAQHPEDIDARLAELDHEWDIERSLEANAATITVASVALGLFASRKWFFLPGLVGGFLLQHALKGWCPPLPVFRRLGVRTQAEIERERHILKTLRGDYNHLKPVQQH